MEISNKVLDCIEILSKSNDVINTMIADATPEVDSLFGEIASKISDLIRNIKNFTRDIFIIERYIVCDRAKDLYPAIEDIPEEIKKQVISHRKEDEICLFTLEPCSCNKDPETLVKKLKYFLDEMDKRRDKSASISEDLSNSISKIREEFEKFNQDIAFIVEIAEKVDLIAINAYVEAARMGEKGKGFEIIAENIRKAALDIQTHGKNINLKFAELEDEFIKNEDIFKNYIEHEKLRKENDKKASETIKKEIVELVSNFVKFVEFTSKFSKDIFEKVQTMQVELTEKMQYVDIYNQRIGNIGKKLSVITEMIMILMGFFKNEINEEQMYKSMKELEDKFKKIATVFREFEITSEKMDYDLKNHTEIVGEKLEDAEGEVELF